MTEPGVPEPREASDNLESIDIVEPQGFKLAVQDIDAHTAAVSSILRSFVKGCREPSSTNYRTQLELLQQEENLIFSDIPSFVEVEMVLDKEKNASFNAGVPSRVDAPRNAALRDYSDPHKAYVSCGTPLLATFNYSKFLAENPDWEQKGGTYHDLFFGDGSGYVFKAPDDNKRAQLEAQKALKESAPKQEPSPALTFDKPTLKVGRDFVPSCASVDHSAAQQRLREKKAQRNQMQHEG